MACGPDRRVRRRRVRRLLALVAAALLGAGAVVGLGEVGDGGGARGADRHLHRRRATSAGRSDAEAAGLRAVHGRRALRGERPTVSVAWVRIGGDDGWTVATRSDGSVIVTQHGRARRAARASGLGVEASPLGRRRWASSGKVDFTLMQRRGVGVPRRRGGARGSSPATATTPADVAVRRRRRRC